MSAYFQSESFSLLLKCLTAVSAFGFGAYGVGAETRAASITPLRKPRIYSFASAISRSNT